MRDESGFALIGAMLILIILIGIGLSLVALSDTQQNLSGSERVRESSFNLAEAALNAESLQLGRSWPTSTAPATTTCDPTTSSVSYCPSPSAIGNGYNTGDYAASCPGSAPPLWKTQVHDNGVSGQSQFWSTAVNTQPSYDANGDGMVWVRSWAQVQCKTISMVGLVSPTSVPFSISDSVVTANFLSTSNQGKKVIIDTLGSYAQPPSIRPGPAAQPSKIVLRCTGVPSGCANYAANKGQIQPPAVQTNATVASQALTAVQLQALEQQAAAAGTLYTSTCPANNTPSAITSPASGAPVVVQGPCNISETSNGSINSATNPGVLVIENGTLTLGGTVNFYGLIYMVNKQASSGVVLTIQGNATVQGAVNVDGNGGVMAGSSKTNLIYDQRATRLLKGTTGAAINRGSVRMLPPSTP